MNPRDVLGLLARENPAFQLKSGVPELPSSEDFFAVHGGADTAQYARSSAALPLQCLRALEALLEPDHTTLETGGGQSTVVFGSKVRRHYCVNPDRTANELIVQFMEHYEIRGCDLVFVDAPSPVGLPSLTPEPLDVVLLDGSHSFPVPLLDWYYVNPHLRVGGHLLVDNVEINSVRILTEFLRLEPSYRLVGRVTGSHRYDCFTFQKVKATSVVGWGGQPINRAVLWRLFAHSALARLDRPWTKLVQRLRGRA